MVTIKIVQSQDSKNFEKAIKNLSKKVGKVGWFEGSLYPLSTVSNVGPVKPISAAYIAAIQEYGSPSRNIPARPFMGPTIHQQQNEWKKIMTDGAKKIIKGTYTIQNLMETIGLKAAGDIRKTITQIFSPPLKPSTIQARIRKYTSDVDLKASTHKKRKKEVQRFVSSGFYKPLIDTGYMYKTLTNTVEDE